MTVAESLRDPETFPRRTPPNNQNKPRFVESDELGPKRYSDEKRRHYYKKGIMPVKIKVMLKNGDAQIWYRVSDGDAIGWQSRKPVGFKELPFFGSLDPFDPEQSNQPIFWPEGEKDADTVTSHEALAITFGGVGDGLPRGCEEFFRGRHVIVLADNDKPGRDHAEEKAALAYRVAASVKVIHFTDVPHKGDVTKFMELGRTLDDLRQMVDLTPVYKPRGDPYSLLKTIGSTINATPYRWTDPTTIPRRDFVYGKHLIRKFVSATVAPGGVGKSSLIVTEVLAMASGKNLLGVHPASRSKVWLFNLEDPAEELARHIQATAKQFGLSASDIEDYLFVDSGRDQRLVITTSDRRGTFIVEAVVDNIVSEIIEHGIDVLIIDPFVSSHEAPENDNGAMDRIVKEWGRVAQRGNCAVELVHHSRKSSAGETEITVESSRGGKAVTDGCRSVRVLNRMSKEEGERAGVENHRAYFRTYIDKPNLTPPAETSMWFKLTSVDLGNGDSQFGDCVGVVVPWQWPDIMADVSINDLRAVQQKVSEGRYRASPQAGDWVGKAVAEVMRYDLSRPAEKRKVMYLIKEWLGSGALKRVEENDDKGMSRPFITVGDRAND